MTAAFWFVVGVADVAVVGYLTRAVLRRLERTSMPGDDAWREFWEREYR